MKKRYFKNVIATLSIALLGISYAGVVVEANADSRDTGKYSSMTWYSYNGNGVLDGSDNGVYYSLTPGNVSFAVSSTNSNSSYPSYMNLRRVRVGYDADYGQRKITGTGTYNWNVDAISSEYYLQAYSFNYNRNEAIYGRMHNH